MPTVSSCGAAKKGKIDVIQELAHLVRAERRVNALMPQLNVSSFIDVHYPDGNKKNLFVNPDAFETWLQTQSPTNLTRYEAGFESLLIPPNQPGTIF